MSDVKAEDQLRRYTDSPFASATKTVNTLGKNSKIDPEDINLRLNALQKSNRALGIRSINIQEEQENVKSNSDEEQKAYKGVKKLAFPTLNTNYRSENLERHQIAENKHQIPKKTITCK